jgi:hypothetical protein
MHKFISAILCIFGLAVCNSLAYGTAGHEIVGAIADERLANTPEGKQVGELLDGLSLEKTAVIADEIKGWDEKGVDDLKSFHYSLHPKIDAQLRDFWRANQPTHDTNSAMPSHHWFHYADVPLVPPQKYGDGKAGRSNWDVVHMIGYCVEVLRGSVPENNERKITKPIAIILLSHYVGDIHQPLHVAAEYFDQRGHVVDPANAESALADEGGNTLVLRLAGDPPGGHLSHTKSLHGFWDLDAVNALLPTVPETMPKKERRATIMRAQKALAHEMAVQEPQNWKLPADLDLKKYAKVWADEIIPIARQAHERLTFRNVKPAQEEDRVVASGEADENTAPDHMSYRDWTVKIVRSELHKAGWRLADLLQKSLASTAASESSTK